MSSIETYYGGSVLAMKGKDAIVITADRRIGNSLTMINNTFSRLYVLTPRIVIGLLCFIPDTQMIYKDLRKHINMFQLSQGREIEPQEVCSLLSYILYTKRFSPYYIEPLIVGFDRQNNPHIYKMDCIGCVSAPPFFTATGTGADNLMGIAEIIYEEQMEEENLFTKTMQAFLNGIDRDSLSGCGAEAFILTPHKRVYREIEGKQD